jgi:hypothetical protein
MSLTAMLMLASGIKFGRNCFQAGSPASEGLAGVSLQRFEGKLILWGW